MNLPVRGQSSKTNARTVKGPKNLLKVIEYFRGIIEFYNLAREVA